VSPVNIFLFLAGVSRLVMLNVGGQLYLTDLLLAGSFVFLMLNPGSRRHLFARPVVLLIILAALYLLNAIITDIYRDTPFDDWSRGWSKIIFLFLDLLGLVLVTELKLPRISAFMLGIAFAYLIEPRFFPKVFLLDFDPAWKFAYSPALTTFAALVGTSALARRLYGGIGEWVPLAALGVANLAFDYRSMFGIAMAAVGFGVFKHAIDLRPQFRAKITPAAFAFLAAGGLAFSQGMIAVYGMAAGNGWLGLEATDKYLAQTSGDLGLLQSGRTEQLVSIRAIADSPIIGHGSWAKDYAYVSLMIDILESKGVPYVEYYGGDLIPTHSHLSGAWVEAGVMGGVFWLAVIGIAIKALYVELKQPRTLATFVGFILFSLLWDVLFSPFGAEQRYLMSSKICVALWVLAGSRHKPNSFGSKSGAAAL
jgi:hypothetical protein